VGPLTTAWRVVSWRMEARLPIWRVDANVLKKQSCTADRGWYCKEFTFGKRKAKNLINLGHLRRWPDNLCLARQPQVDQASSFMRFLDHTHNDAPQSVGLLWTSDQPEAETCTWQHTTLTTDKHPLAQWDSNPQSQQASGHRLTP